MSFADRKIKLASLGLILFGALIFVLVNFTGVSNLEAVTFNGHPVENFDGDLGLSSDRPIFKQPLDSLGAALLTHDDIARVDIDYSLPNRISIVTNRFDPVCFALDMSNGRMMGLTSEGRVVPIDPDQSDWELPTITSVHTGKLYDYTSDVRVRLIVEKLLALKLEQPDLFRLITEIDLAKPEYTWVSVSGLPYHLRVGSAEFDQELIGFLKFLEKYHPSLENTRELDLRYDDMIIQVREGR